MTTQTLHIGQKGAGTVHRTILPNGLRIVTERMPAVRSVAVGMWVGIGSRDEAAEHMGATHFLEHLLFKGTHRRTARDISWAIESVGGEINAFTAKEYTCYLARVLDQDVPLAIDVLSDLVTSSLIDPAEVELERGVILEEIAMNDDDPTDVVHEQFTQELFGDTPLGRPTLGTVDIIKAISRDGIADYYERFYQPPRTVIAVAGNVDHDAVVELAVNAYERAAGPAEPHPPRLTGPGASLKRAVRVVDRQTEQGNILLGTLGVSRMDDRRFALGVLNEALGGGMSSRLFQEIREKRGLAYATHSFSTQFADTGMFGIYAGCQPERIEEVVRICRDELGKVLGRGLTEEEIALGKGQLRGSLVLGLENTGARMSRIGKSELVYDRLISVDEILSEIDAVTAEDLEAVARDILTQPLTLTAVGPYADRDFAPYVEPLSSS